MECVDSENSEKSRKTPLGVQNEAKKVTALYQFMVSIDKSCTLLYMILRPYMEMAHDI